MSLGDGLPKIPHMAGSWPIGQGSGSTRAPRHHVPGALQISPKSPGCLPRNHANLLTRGATCESRWVDGAHFEDLGVACMFFLATPWQHSVMVSTGLNWYEHICFASYDWVLEKLRAMSLRSSSATSRLHKCPRRARISSHQSVFQCEYVDRGAWIRNNFEHNFDNFDKVGSATIFIAVVGICDRAAGVGTDQGLPLGFPWRGTRWHTLFGGAALQAHGLLADLLPIPGACGANLIPSIGVPGILVLKKMLRACRGLCVLLRRCYWIPWL